MGHGARRRAVRLPRPNRRRQGVSDGPWSGRALGRMLERRGYQLMKLPAADEFAVYIAPDRARKNVPVNLDWEFAFGDQTFKSVCRDLGIGVRELRRSLNA